MLKKDDSPIIKVIEIFVEKNIEMMFMSRYSDLRSISEMSSNEAIKLISILPFFSAYRTLHITKRNFFINSPILIFFSAFKSWFFHNILHLAKNLEIVKPDSNEANFLKNNNLLSIWKLKDEIFKNDKNY